MSNYYSMLNYRNAFIWYDTRINSDYFTGYQYIDMSALRNYANPEYIRNYVYHDNEYLDLEQQPQAQTVYDDAQNVHSLGVQQAIHRSIQNILADPEPSFALGHILEAGLPDDVSSFIRQACSIQDTHSTLGVNYETVLLRVWQRIENSEHKEELISILTPQIRDSIPVCSTGKISRLVAALVGFFDDVSIEISDSERIQAIIQAIKNSLDPYTVQEHHDIVRDRLIELEYDTETIQPWLNAILEQED